MPKPDIAAPVPSPRSLLALDALNLFLADVRDGLGPYLAIYLIAVRGPAHGWNEATTGMVITIAGICGLVAQTPAGVLIDRSRHKRLIVIAAAAAITISCIALIFVDGFLAVVATQSNAAIGGAVIAPALTAITLGIVGPRAFARRVGRNEAFNHAGNAVAATIAGIAAWRFGPVVVFWLMAVLTLLSIVAAASIPPGEIDDRIAQGCAKESDDAAPAGGWRALAGNRPLLLFAVSAFAFHLANAAMLTSVGQLLARVVGKHGATSLMAACIVAAQLVMVPVAMIAGRYADSWGRKPLMLAGFAVLALRGVLYTLSDDRWWLVGVQALDGIGAGIFGALFPVIVADLTRDSGRFNTAQGAVATAQGLGAALSAGLAGWIIVASGYTPAFLTLAAIAGGGFVLYLLAVPETAPDARPAAARPATA